MTSKTILSPTSARISGLLSGSPGNALKASVLKSDDSIKVRDTGMSFPVGTTGAANSPPCKTTTAGGDEIQ